MSLESLQTAVAKIKLHFTHGSIHTYHMLVW